MKASKVIQELLKNRFTRFTGVPCSIVKPLINYVIDSEDCDYIPATIEGEAASIGTGAYMAGINSVVLLQNSGLGNIVNPLTSLVEMYRTPCLFFVTWRGEPGRKDAPQHGILGEVRIDLLKALKVPHAILEDSTDSLTSILERARTAIKNDGKSFVVILKKGLIEPYELKTEIKYAREVPFEMLVLGERREETSDLPSREDAAVYISQETEGFPVISSTGFTSREFHNVQDRESNFYMQGSMGFALPISLGLSLYYKEKVFCLDGDGACLMRLGGLFTSGAFNKGNLVYILLDNSCHDSTGGQPTVSSNVKFSKLSEAAGFERYIEVNDVDKIPEAISFSKSGNAFTFIHIRIRPGKGNSKGRPGLSPVEITDRFKAFIKKNT